MAKSLAFKDGEWLMDDMKHSACPTCLNCECSCGTPTDTCGDCFEEDKTPERMVVSLDGVKLSNGTLFDAINTRHCLTLVSGCSYSLTVSGTSEGDVSVKYNGQPVGSTGLGYVTVSSSSHIYFNHQQFIRLDDETPNCQLVGEGYTHTVHNDLDSGMQGDSHLYSSHVIGGYGGRANPIHPNDCLGPCDDEEPRHIKYNCAHRQWPSHMKITITTPIENCPVYGLAICANVPTTMILSWTEEQENWRPSTYRTSGWGTFDSTNHEAILSPGDGYLHIGKNEPYLQFHPEVGRFLRCFTSTSRGSTASSGPTWRLPLCECSAPVTGSGIANDFTHCHSWPYAGAGGLLKYEPSDGFGNPCICATAEGYA